MHHQIDIMNFYRTLTYFILLSILISGPKYLEAQKRFSISLLGNLEASFMNIGHSNAEVYNSGIYEKGGIGLGYAFGIQPQLLISKRVFVRSGLNLEHSTYKSLMKGLRFIDGNDSKIVLKNTSYTIGIPLELGRNSSIKNDKLSLNYGIGFIYNYFISKKASGKIKGSSGENSNLKQTKNIADLSIFSAYIFYGFLKNVSNKFDLGIESYLKYTPNKFTTAIYESTAKTLFESGINFRLKLK